MEDRVCAHKCTRTLFFGPTGAGTSTLVNHLLGKNILKSGGGHTTARACIIRYAPWEKARIFLMKNVGDELVYDGDDSDFFTGCEPFDLEKRKKWYKDAVNKLRTSIDKYCFKEGIDITDSSKIKEWIDHVVVVEFPFEYLQKMNMEIVDLSGTSENDVLADFLMDQRMRFVRAYKPDRVVLTYKGPFELGEMRSYKELRNLTRSPIFFVNTQFDIRTLDLEREGLKCKMHEQYCKLANFHENFMFDEKRVSRINDVFKKEVENCVGCGIDGECLELILEQQSRISEKFQQYETSKNKTTGSKNPFPIIEKELIMRKLKIYEKLPKEVTKCNFFSCSNAIESTLNPNNILDEYFMRKFKNWILLEL